MNSAISQAFAWGRAFAKTPGETSRSAVSQAISELLKSDVSSVEILAKLDGRVMAIGLRDTNHRALVSLSPNGATIVDDEAIQPDVTVIGAIKDFVAYARASRRGDSLGAGRIEISGDLQTAQDVQALLTNLRVDIEAVLAPVVGGIAAHQIALASRAAARQGRQTAERFEEDFAEYLLSEARILPTRREVEQQARAGFILRDDTERFEARLDRLERQRQS